MQQSTVTYINGVPVQNAVVWWHWMSSNKFSRIRSKRSGMILIPDKVKHFPAIDVTHILGPCHVGPITIQTRRQKVERLRLM